MGISKQCVINMVLEDGDPDGIRTSMIVNATIKAIAFRRNQLDKVSPSLSKPGVYLLYGQDPSKDGNMVYIGESEDIAARLKFHKSDSNKPKEYWEDTFAIISQTDDLTKSHARYLEAKLIALASDKIGWTVANEKLTNGKPPKAVSLPMMDTIKMDEIVEQAKILVRTFGCNLFRISSGQLVTGAANSEENFGAISPEFQFSGTGFSAKAVVLANSGEWIVKKQSTAKLTTANALSSGVKILRQQLIDAGKLKEFEGSLVFTEDCVFRSASTGASLVSGSPRDGRNKAWKLSDGTTFAEWESATEIAATLSSKA